MSETATPLWAPPPPPPPTAQPPPMETYPEPNPPAPSPAAPPPMAAYPAQNPPMPPPVAPEPAPRRRRSWLAVAIAAVLALLIGAAAGYAAGLPARNDLRDQKQATEVARDQLQADLTAAKGDLEDAQKSLASTKKDLASSSAAKEACSTAANDANELVVQFENLLDDLSSDVAPGSAAEKALIDHVNQQAREMGSQARVVKSEFESCKSAVG